MTTLWRPDPELTAARRLQSWPLFHKAIGQSNLHTQNERREHGECVVPFYAVLQTYRQQVGEGRGSTIITATAQGFLKVANGTTFSRPANIRARLALLDLLLS